MGNVKRKDDKKNGWMKNVRLTKFSFTFVGEAFEGTQMH